MMKLKRDKKKIIGFIETHIELGPVLEKNKGWHVIKKLNVELMKKGAKKLIDESWVAPLGEGLTMESDIQSRIMGYENNIEAVMATVQKRPAKFK